jgi:membrane fusion protein, macrolide-specific efflux system
MSLAKRSKRIIFYGLLILVGVGVYYKYFHAEDKIMYITEDIKRRDIQKVVDATGEVRAIELVTVGAQASGKIEKLYVKVGQEVKKGDMIAQIDSTTQQNDVNSAKARLNSYKAQLSAANISLKIAEKQYQRTKILQQKSAASAEELEDAQNAYEAAKSKVAEIESSLKEVEISLSTAETNLGYTKITAPLDGMVVSVPVKEGQTVNAAMSTPTIVQIADLRQMEILIEISEGDIDSVHPGQKVTYSTLAELNKEYETTLNSIDPGLTLLTNGEYSEVVGSSEAIYYYGRLIVPNEERKLRIGMTTQNIIYVAFSENVFAVPLLAVKEGENGKYIEILESEDKLRRVPVTTGVSDGLRVEINGNVSEGDKVVLAQMSASEASAKVESVRRR